MNGRPRLAFHSDAAAEIDGHVAYFKAEASQRVAERYVQQLRAVLDILEKDPDRFPVDSNGIRRAHFRKYPFTIYFEVLPGGQPYVWAVTHQRRKPGYWANRHR